MNTGKLEFSILTHKAESTANLNSCWKRAISFARKDTSCAFENHKMGIRWSNALMFLEAHKDDYREQTHFLDWFATGLNKYAEDNILEGDNVLAAILYEWKEWMFFDPTKLNNKET